jgi:hypothetical protein
MGLVKVMKNYEISYQTNVESYLYFSRVDCSNLDLKGE